MYYLARFPRLPRRQQAPQLRAAAARAQEARREAVLGPVSLQSKQRP